MGTAALNFGPNVAAVLTPVNFKGSTIPLSAQYVDENGHLVSLQQTGEVVYKKKPAGSVKEVTFSTTSPRVLIQKMRDTEYDENLMKRELDFWKDHPCVVVTVNGERVQGQDNKKELFHLEILRSAMNEKYKTFLQKVSVCNEVLKLGSEELYEVCWRYNIDPRERTEKELVLALADLETGILMSRGNREEFLRYSKGEVDKDETKTNELIALANRAVKHKVITKNEQGVFYLDKDRIGSEIDHVIDFLAESKGKTDFVKKEVKKLERDDRKRFDDSHREEQVLPEYNKLNETADIEKLRKIAKGLKIQGWAVFKRPEQFVKKIRQHLDEKPDTNVEKALYEAIGQPEEV